MGLLNSIPTPTLNFQPALHKTPEELLSHMKALGITFDRGSEATSFASYTDLVDYLKTAPANHPRINFINSLNKGYLTEGVSKNELLYSNEFSNSWWRKENVSVTSQSNDKLGTIWEAKDSNDGSNEYHFVGRITNITGNTNVINRSVIVKAGTLNKVNISTSGSLSPEVSSSVTGRVLVDLTDGSVIDSDNATNIDIKALGDGFYRVKFNRLVENSTADDRFSIIMVSDSATNAITDQEYTGDGTGTIYIAYAQLEDDSSVASSIIENSASTLTRAADKATISGSEFTSRFSKDKGSIVINFNVQSIRNDNQYLFSADNASSSEVLSAYIDNSGDLIISVVSSSSESVSLNMGAITAEIDYSVSITYDSNGISASLDGGAISTDASITLPSPDAFGIGRKTYEDTEMLNGTIGRCLIFNQRVSDDLLRSFSRGL